jgi:hypothetical protein
MPGIILLFILIVISEICHRGLPKKINQKGLTDITKKSRLQLRVRVSMGGGLDPLYTGFQAVRS